MSLALVYVRQSDHKRYERTTSPEVQLAECMALPAVRACGQNVEVFKDLGKSGGKLNGRTGFRDLLQRVQGGGVTVVAAYDQSRTFRNAKDALEFRALLSEPAFRTIEVVFVQGEFRRTPVGAFEYTILAAAHQMEREMTAEKIAAARHHASAQGLAVGEIPAGYKWDSDKVDRKLVVDEPVAAIVRRVFQEYAQGRRGTEIAERLNAEGTRLPNMRGEWRWSQVNAVLRNVAYHGQTYTVSRSRREGALRDAQWPAIVDDELWAATKARARQQRPGNYAGTHAHVFRGLLRCTCGARLHVAQPKPNYTYYYCRRDGTSRQQCTNQSYIREETLLPWARDVFAHLDRDARRPASLSRAGDEAIATRRLRAQPDALASIDATLARLGKRYEWGHLDDAAYRAQWETLQAQRAEILAAGRVPERDRVSEELSGALALWDAARDDRDMRRRMLLILFEELDVRDGEIVGYKPRADRAARVHELMAGAFDGLAARFA